MKWTMTIWCAFSAILLADMGIDEATPAMLTGASLAGFGIGWLLGRWGDAWIERHVGSW